MEYYQNLLQPDYGALTLHGNKDSWTKLLRVPYMGDVGSYPYTKALYLPADDQVPTQISS